MSVGPIIDADEPFVFDMFFCDRKTNVLTVGTLILLCDQRGVGAKLDHGFRLRSVLS